MTDTNAGSALVFEDAGTWWFFNEAFDAIGPYETRLIAEQRLTAYLVYLDTGVDPAAKANAESE